MANFNENEEYVSHWLRIYFEEDLMTYRNAATLTIASYSETMYRVVSFAAGKCGVDPDFLKLEQLDVNMVRDYLSHIEKDLGNSVKTRNQRRSAIASWAKYVSGRCPRFSDWSRLIRSIPVKKCQKENNLEEDISPEVDYLTKDQMKVLINTPDTSTPLGRRDRSLLQFAWNTGARASEICDETVGQIHQDNKHMAFALLNGKGGKQRQCPLWEDTLTMLEPFLDGKKSTEPVFVNRLGQKLTRFGIYEIVEKYALKAKEIDPTMANVKIHPHIIRHSVAMALLESGVDINTIRCWLGHVSLDTTRIYAEANLRMKAKALQSCNLGSDSDTGENANDKKWKQDNVLEFLKKLQNK